MKRLLFFIFALRAEAATLAELEARLQGVNASLEELQAPKMIDWGLHFKGGFGAQWNQVEGDSAGQGGAAISAFRSGTGATAGLYLHGEGSESGSKVSLDLNLQRPGDATDLIGVSGAAARPMPLGSGFFLGLENSALKLGLGQQWMKGFSPLTWADRRWRSAPAFERSPYASLYSPEAFYDGTFSHPAWAGFDFSGVVPVMGALLESSAGPVKITAIYGNSQGFFDNLYTHDAGISLSLGSLSATIANHSNDKGEISSLGGNAAAQPIGQGLQNCTVSGFLLKQNLGGEFQCGLEGAYSAFDGVVQHRKGEAGRAAISWGSEGALIELGGEHLAPGFYPGAGQLIGAGVSEAFLAAHDGVWVLNLSDPQAPILNSELGSLRGKLRGGFGAFELGLRAGSEASESPAIVAAKHALSGEDRSGGLWWNLFEQGSQAARLAAYNAGARRDLHTDLWRRNSEWVHLKDPATGLALAPSKKSFGNASSDLRLAMKPFYLNAYGEFNAAQNEGSLAFAQKIVSLCLVWGIHKQAYALIHAGYETWVSDLALPQDRLFYADRQAGLGFDFEVIPGSLGIFLRAKVLRHHDALVGENSFIARQMSLQTQMNF